MKLETQVPTVTNDALAAAMKAVAAMWAGGPADFINGDCHALAVALYRAMDGQGRLLAGFTAKMRRGKRVCGEYAHMVYQAPQGTTWDIGGRNADGRWEEAFGFDEYLWQPVPEEGIGAWLTAHNATLNERLAGEVEAALRPLLRLAA